MTQVRVRKQHTFIDEPKQMQIEKFFAQSTNMTKTFKKG